jgi:hypothetical protein
MYRQQWQADQQKHIIAQMAGKMPSKQMMEKEKIMIEIITIPMEDAVVLSKAILDEDDTDNVEEAMC